MSHDLGRVHRNVAQAMPIASTCRWLAAGGLVLLFTICCNGCSNDNLSREKAKAAITEKYKLPEETIERFIIVDPSVPI